MSRNSNLFQIYLMNFKVKKRHIVFMSWDFSYLYFALSRHKVPDAVKATFSRDTVHLSFLPPANIRAKVHAKRITLASAAASVSQ